MESLSYADLLSPRSLKLLGDAEPDIFQGIPIKTWTSDSPVKKSRVNGSTEEDSLDEIDYSEGMDAYFAKNVGQIDEDNDDQEDDALIQEMEDYLAGGDDQSAVEDDEANDEEGNEDDGDEEDDDDEEEYEEDYEDFTKANNAGSVYGSLFELSHQQQATDEEEDGDDDYEDDEEEEGEEDDEDVKDIVNDYNDLLQYMSSPRGEPVPQPAARKQGSQPLLTINNNYNIKPTTMTNAFNSQVNGFYNEEVLKSLEQLVHSKQQPSSLSQPHQHKPSMPKKKKNKKQSKTIKSSGLSNNIRRSEKKLKAISKDLVLKHKHMLAEMSQRRREEEEEVAQIAAMMQEKRKKFKEALLEKALRARKQQEDNAAADVQQQQQQPSFLAPTVAYKQQSVSKKGTDLNNANLTEDELIKQEERKREYIIAIRRKFKEQHKKILMALVDKKREEQAKVEQAKLLDEVKRERRRQKIMKLLAEKEAASSSAAIGIVDNGNNNAEESAETLPFITNEAVAAVAQAVTTTVGSKHKKDGGKSSAVGSALSAIRAASVSTKAIESELMPVYVPPSPSVAAANAAVAEASAKSVPTAKETAKETKEKPASNVNGNNNNAFQEQQRAKLADYLLNLADAKRREEHDKIKLEERKKRRMILLSQRILQEANERKAMNNEDTLAPSSAPPPAATGGEGEGKKKKITLEMAETIAKRLGLSKQPSTTITAASAAVPPSSVPITTEKEKEKVVRRKQPSTATTAAAASTKSASVAPAYDTLVTTTATKENKENTTLNSTTVNRDVLGVSLVPARDFNDWKRKNSVPIDAKVFSMTGWYPCVKQALLDRGWYFNADPTSSYFNLKWSLRSLDVNVDTLQSWQLINHYMKNIAITTKFGLIRSLQSLKWMADIDANDIIPRAYDLSVIHEMQIFLDDFRCQRAENMLKKLYFMCTGLEAAVPSKYANDFASASAGVKSVAVKTEDPELSSSTVEINPPADTADGEDDDAVIPPVPTLKVKKNKRGEDEEIVINVAVFNSICRILNTLLHPYDDSYLDDHNNNAANENGGGGEKAVLDIDWEIIENYDLHLIHNPLPLKAPEPIDSFVTGKDDEVNESKLSQGQKRERRRREKLAEEIRQIANDQIQQTRVITQQDVNSMHTMLCRLHYYHGAQQGMNGKFNNAMNMWIVKPAARSRGRGITTFNDLPKLLKYVQACAGSSGQWIVQKYMENPLIIANRKFDLRQWVLVTDWNPLTIYFYDEFYARFSVEEYSNDEEALSNSFIHLVNNSIGKKSENFGKIVTAENGVVIDGYMWSHTSFAEYIQGKTGQDLVKTKMQPRMKEIAQWSLMCGAEIIEHRKNSWELYGFDYMIDDEYNVWLIEINSSPACDYSTKVTERYVQKALVEILDVVLDVREWEALPKKTRDTEPKPDTGGWDCIYKGPVLELPVGAFGTEMTLKGEQCKGQQQYRRMMQQQQQQTFIPPTVTSGAAAAHAGSQQQQRSLQQQAQESSKVKRQTSSLRTTAAKNNNKAEVDSEQEQDGGGNFDDSDEENSLTRGERLSVINARFQKATTSSKMSGSQKAPPQPPAAASGSSVKARCHHVAQPPQQGSAAVPLKVFTMDL